MSPVLEFTNVVAGYGDTMVLRGVSGLLERGQVLGVLGRNGVGKTTLMRALYGFIPLMDGEISANGENLSCVQPQRRLAAGIAYAPQEDTVFGDLSVSENLRLHLKERDMSRYRRYFDAFPRLEERALQRAGSLSGGERKLLSFTRTLGLQAPLSLLDEPTEGVQPENITKMGDLVLARRDVGAAFVIVEQNLSFLLQVSDRVLVLDHGECVASGSISTFTRETLESYLVV